MRRTTIFPRRETREIERYLLYNRLPQCVWRISDSPFLINGVKIMLFIAVFASPQSKTTVLFFSLLIFFFLNFTNDLILFFLHIFDNTLTRSSSLVYEIDKYDKYIIIYLSISSEIKSIISTSMKCIV